MSPSPRALIHSGTALVAGRRRTVRCEAASDGYLLHVGRNTFHVDESGLEVRSVRSVRLVPADPADLDDLRAPADVLALSLRGFFCLHASAVERDGRAIAFVGRSGRGKSTLATHLAKGLGRGWRHVADDILPVDLAAARPEAIGGAFPRGRSYEERRIPLAALYVLGGPTREGIALRPLSGRDSFLSFARHTAGSRLFPRELRARHFEACVHAASVVPVLALRYPRRLDLLGAVSGALELESAGAR